MDLYFDILLELYKAHGELIFENPSLIKEEMSGYSNVERSKVYALSSAIEEKVPVTLRDSGSLSEEDLNLIGKGFAEGTGIKEELAVWAVNTLYRLIRVIEEDPSLRRMKRKARLQEGHHVEVKEGLAKATVIKGGATSIYTYDGSISFADFLETYLEEGDELAIEISGDVEIERPITVQGKKLIFSGLQQATVYSEILPAFEVVKSELILENLSFKYTKEPERTIGLIYAVESSLELSKVEIHGAGLKVQTSKVFVSKSKLTGCKYIGIHAENSELRLQNSDFQGNGIDIFSPQMRFKGCRVLLKNCKIDKGNGSGIWADNSELNIDKVVISGNYYYGIFIDAGGFLHMSNSRLVENGNSEDNYPQLKLVSSKANLKNCRVLNGINNSGISIEDKSSLECEDLKVTGHYYNGIEVKDDSEILLRNGEIARNGNEDEDNPQMVFISSRGYLKNLKIHGGINNSGVVLDEGSRVELISSQIYRHFFNALTLKSASEALLSDCAIYHNGNENFHAPQIWASSAVLKVENSNIYDGVKNDGIYIRNSNVTFENVSIHNHFRRALFAEANSNVVVKNSRIYSNNKGSEGEAQIEVRSTVLKLSDSEIDGSVNAAGVYATDISVVEINKSRISGNYSQGVWFSSNTSFNVSDCYISENLGKDGMFPQILITSSRGKFERTTVTNGSRVSGMVIERSFVQMVECSVTKNENFGIYVLSNSIADLKACEVANNGQENKDFAQIKVENSKLILNSSKVTSGINNTGISIVESSYAEMENTVVSQNPHHGIEVYYNSELRFLGGEISNNGSDNESYAQVWIGSSYAIIKDSIIHDGKENIGIGILKSYVELENCKIFGHRDEGINLAWYSGIKIKECQIYSNAMNSSAAQLSVTSSNCLTRGCEIYESVSGDGVKADDGAVVELDNTKIYRNKAYGIIAKDGSEVKISGCEITENNEVHKNGFQIVLENSRGIIKNSKISKGINGGGIKLSHSYLVEIYHSVISEHKGAGIEVADNISRLKIVGVSTFKNEKGGLVYKNPYKVSTIDSNFEDGAFRKS